MRVVVTGASGFIGRACCKALTQAGHDVTAVVRTNPRDKIWAARVVPLGDLTQVTDYSQALGGADTVVHLVARTHITDENEAGADGLYSAANVGVLIDLAEAAVRAGVRRFVFLSSIKVNGEATHGKPFTAADVPAPEDAYGRSKAAAERRLREISEHSGMEFVILRPPLIYGPGMRGNMERLFGLVESGIPLPFASIHNSRDILSVDALADLIVAAVSKPEAKNRIFLARDGAPVATPQLLKAIAASLKRKAWLIPVPVSILKAIARWMGREGEVNRLVGDLEIDDTATRSILGWKPRRSMPDALAETAYWFRAR